MNSLPRVFVGTMHAGEGDFEACTLRIQQQQHVVVTHRVVSGLKEKDAHNALWTAWRTVKHDHDLFIKVDADTVLSTPDTLAQIWQLFAGDPRVTGVQCPLDDYMTDGPINGLNAFGSKVVFADTQDGLYCDRVDTGHDVVLRGDQLPSQLRPAGQHCYRATDLQAYHYGVHRMLKGQHANITSVRRAWERHHDRTRAMALLGAADAFLFSTSRAFNYGDAEFVAAFNAACADFDRRIALL